MRQIFQIFLTLETHPKDAIEMPCKKIRLIILLFFRENTVEKPVWRLCSISREFNQKTRFKCVKIYYLKSFVIFSFDSSAYNSMDCSDIYRFNFLFRAAILSQDSDISTACNGRVIRMI